MKETILTLELIALPAHAKVTYRLSYKVISRSILEALLLFIRYIHANEYTRPSWQYIDLKGHYINVPLILFYAV